MNDGKLLYKPRRALGGRWMQTTFFVAALSALCLICGCTQIPDGLHAVQGFQLERYLGKWYEIARLDHSFERNLNNVTAEYALRAGDGVTVINRGFDAKKGKWQEAQGVARFTDGNDVGSLKVSFFGPFWGGYHIIALDEQNYRYAMVSGPSRSFLWILSRDKALDDKTLTALIGKATKWGFDTKKLIFVKQDLPDKPPVGP